MTQVGMETGVYIGKFTFGFAQRFRIELHRRHYLHNFDLTGLYRLVNLIQIIISKIVVRFSDGLAKDGRLVLIQDASD